MKASIRNRLLFLLFTSSLLIWMIIAGVSWWNTGREVRAMLDAQLVQTARLLAVTTLHESDEHDLAEYESDLWRHGYDYARLFQVWSDDGRLLIRGPGSPLTHLSGNRIEGYSEEQLNGRRWRVYTLIVGDRSHVIQVADDYSVRVESVRDFALSAMKPMLIIFPLLLLVWIGIERGLAPLRWIAREISERTPQSLKPVQNSRVPREITPLVEEINELFLRLQESLERYSRFTADAAHELRTPLAGALTQAHAAINAGSDQERDHALHQLMRGLSTLKRLVEQLLTLARIDPGQSKKDFAEVSLNSVSMEVLSRLTPQALSLQVDVELQADDEISVPGNSELMGLMLGNLLENSIRAASPGGRVTVRVGWGSEGPSLVVEDTGPGIPEQDMNRVFDRFYRRPGTPGPGAGIGLSIVRSIVELHDATMVLANRQGHPGLSVTVIFPGETGAR
jgi:two-component system sensor histidine kinase QseC